MPKVVAGPNFLETYVGLELQFDNFMYFNLCYSIVTCN